MTTELLGWTRREMNAAITAGEILLMETQLGKWVWREELTAKALELWTREQIEWHSVSKRKPSAARGAARRAADAHPPLSTLDAHYFAEQRQSTVSDVLTREIEGVASDHAAELSSVVPGFDAAFAWPDAERPPLPC